MCLSFIPWLLSDSTVEFIDRIETEPIVEKIGDPQQHIHEAPGGIQQYDGHVEGRWCETFDHLQLCSYMNSRLNGFHLNTWSIISKGVELVETESNGTTIMFSAKYQIEKRKIYFWLETYSV